MREAATSSGQYSLGKLKVRGGTRDALLIAGIVLGAAAFRVPRLTGYEGLSGDEAFSLALAQRSFPDMLHRFTFEANGLLYALLEWPLVRIDDSLLILRLPAFIAGALAPGALYWTGKRIVSRTEAAVAAWLLAISPFAIAHAQLARPYVFAMFFGIVAYGCLARAEDDRRYWIGFVAAMALVGYSNVLAVPLLLAAQAVYVLLQPRLVRAWLRSLLPLAVLLIPLAALVVAERSKRDPLYWLTRPTPRDMTNLAADFMAGRKVLLLGTLVMVAVLLLRRLDDRRLLIVAAWAILPPLGLFIVAQIDPTFWPSYLLPALPGALLLVGSATTRLPRVLAGASLVLLTAGFLHGLFPDNPYHPHGLEVATRALKAERHGDPAVFDIPDGLVAAGFYDRDLAGRDGRLVVSEWADEPIPEGVVLRDDPGGYGRVPAGPPTRNLLVTLLRRTGTVFVFVYSTAKQGDLLESPGLLWAARACDFRATRIGGVVLARLRACSDRSPR